ncbi:MAG: response regulator [Nitrospirota bacterium]|nr:response regulator [Nitrospirota bacterium]MDH5586382.1 response regulator [Nitrospirota bacterium]MDH5774243.1 response regulator [Nitrospirota bacterium]
MPKLDLSRKVLVVDDMMSMRNIVKRALLEIGYKNIHEALNGEEALEKLKSGGFGLVLLDWNMPVMSGIELLRSMRADPTLQAIPVLMITAEAKMDNIMEAVQAGVSDYLVKPFSGQALQEKLVKIFQKLSKENI